MDVSAWKWTGSDTRDRMETPSWFISEKWSVTEMCGRAVYLLTNTILWCSHIVIIKLNIRKALNFFAAWCLRLASVWVCRHNQEPRTQKHFHYSNRIYIRVYVCVSYVRSVNTRASQPCKTKCVFMRKTCWETKRTNSWRLTVSWSSVCN